MLARSLFPSLIKIYERYSIIVAGNRFVYFQDLWANVFEFVQIVNKAQYQIFQGRGLGFHSFSIK